MQAKNVYARKKNHPARRKEGKALSRRSFGRVFPRKSDGKTAELAEGQKNQKNF